MARPGGYCRILKLAKPRLGDNGERAILEFVERTPKKEKPAEAWSISSTRSARVRPESTPRWALSPLRQDPFRF